MKKLALFFVFFSVFIFSNKMKAQYTTHTLLNAGYVYQNGSYGELGAKLLFLKNDDFLYRLGGGVLLGVPNEKFTAIPKIQADVLVNTQKNVDIAHAYYLLAGAELSTRYIAPKIGISLFGVVDVATGYAFPIQRQQTNKEMKGLQIQVSFNIPTVVF